MPHHTSLIAMLVAGFVLAFAFGALAHRLRLSPLVGYLLAGVVVGPFTPGYVADQTLAPQLAEIGVILLMFGVGLHFSLRDLLAVKRIAVPGAVVQIGVATAMGWLLGRALGWSHGAGLMFGLALSVASTVVLLRAMEERNLVESARGRIAVGWLIVEDLAMVLALVLIPAVAGDGEGSPLLAVVMTLAKVAAFVALMLLVGKRVIPWLLELSAATGSRELFTLSVLAIALGVAFGAAVLFGVSFALGAFFAGMLLNESKLSHAAANDSLPLRDAFAVLFFVSVGMLFDPAIVLRQPLAVLATCAIIVLGKSLAAWAIVRAFRHENVTALTIAASLAQIGEFSFILAGLGLALGVLPKVGHDLVLAGALISIVINPLLFVALDRRTAARREDEPEIAPYEGSGHVLLIGYGRVGRQLATLLVARGVPVLAVDDDPDHVRNARADGLPALRGHAASDRVLELARADRAAIAILAIPDALAAGESVAKLRALQPSLGIFARAHGDAEVTHLLQHGADGAVMAERELAYSMAEMVMATPPFRGIGRTAGTPSAANGG